jgi:hypothetical protein
MEGFVGTVVLPVYVFVAGLCLLAPFRPGSLTVEQVGWQNAAGWSSAWLVGAGEAPVRGRSVFEARIREWPPSAAEIVRDGVNGFLVPVAAPADLRLALRRLVAKPDLRRTMGQASLDLARREHAALANHRRIFELMAEVATTDPRRRTTAPR